MSDDAATEELLDLLGQTLPIGRDSRGAPMQYRHEIAPPVPSGVTQVPDLVVPLLTVTDGVALFCADDPLLEEIGAPSYLAVLYDRNDIEFFTADLREQLLDQIEEWHAEGGLSEERRSGISRAANQFHVIGATVDGDSFVVEEPTATSIRIWPHETLLAPFVDPDQAPQVEGLAGLIAWLEAKIRRT